MELKSEPPDDGEPKARECFDCHKYWVGSGPVNIGMVMARMAAGLRPYGDDNPGCPYCGSSNVMEYDSALPAEVDIEEVANESE